MSEAEPMTDQNGKMTSYAYDDVDRLTSVKDAAGKTTQPDMCSIPRRLAIRAA